METVSKRNSEIKDATILSRVKVNNILIIICVLGTAFTTVDAS